MAYTKQNIAIFLKFYADTELYGQKNKLFTFRIYSIDDFPQMLDRLQAKGFVFLKGWIEGKLLGARIFNYEVITSINNQIEYNFKNIGLVKILCRTPDDPRENSNENKLYLESEASELRNSKKK